VGQRPRAGPATPRSDARAGELRGLRASARVARIRDPRGVRTHTARLRGCDGGRFAVPVSERFAVPVSERVGGRVGGRISGRIGGRIGERISGRVGGRVGERVGGRVGERVGERISGRIGERISGRVGERVGERISERISGRVVGRLVERVGVRVCESMGERRRRIRFCTPLGPPHLDPPAAPRSSQCVRPSAIRTGAATNSVRATHDRSSASDPSTR